ncbi:hypothetical protein DSQ20_10050 [Nitrosarchaeum sp. AC2]|nr:hypothetical protein DSQ20_10050 [Nitrosarchaeum sp. AC2]
MHDYLLYQFNITSRTALHYNAIIFSTNLLWNYDMRLELYIFINLNNLFYPNYKMEKISLQ